jgi:4,5-DOPA dioxygenase extradiol
MAEANGTMPALFVGHGSPATAFEPDSPFTRAWAELGERLPRPKAILSISGHWQTEGSAVTAMDRPPTVHDFYGFPQEFYRFHYEAPGSPALAARAGELLQPTPVAQSRRWGFDHGTWTVLMHMFPKADTPVVQLSLDMTRPPAEHYELGRRLAPLREEGVLVMGTGNIVHNLRLFRSPEGARINPLVESFRKEVQARLLQHDHQALTRYLELGDGARFAAPTPDHFLPLIYVAALQRDDETPGFLTEVTENGGVDMTTVVLGGPS